MADRKQLNVRVPPEQKQNWDEYQDELGYQNRSEMIRRAVEYYYSIETGERADPTTGGQGTDYKEINDLKNRMSGLEQDMEQLMSITEDMYYIAMAHMFEEGPEETYDVDKVEE